MSSTPVEDAEIECVEPEKCDACRPDFEMIMNFKKETGGRIFLCARHFADLEAFVDAMPPR